MKLAQTIRAFSLSSKRSSCQAKFFSTSPAFTMKTLGLLGGMTYHATLLYYDQINRHVQSALGGSHSASLLLQSFDHAEMGHLFVSNQWDIAAKKLAAAAKNLGTAGAQAI